jgi:mono/diheme cytochrome c family protein
MKRIIFTTLGTLAVCAALVAAGQAPPRQAPSPAPKKTPAPAKPAAQKPAPNKPAPIMAVAHEGALLTTAEQTAMVKQYCAACHSDRARAGGLSLAAFNAADAAVHVETTEKMIRKLRAGMMPPAGAKRPEGNALAELVAALEQRVDRAAALNPNPGFRPFQRANRAEYGRAVRDLLGIDLDVNAFLPPDTISNGFDNVADSQTLSPTLMEGYLRAASQISRLAIGDRNASATSVTFKVPRTKSQMAHVDGAPIGTRGGVSQVHVFPADGDYIFKAALHYEPLGGLVGRATMSMMNLKEVVEVSIDGERVALLELNSRMSESDANNNLEPQTPPIHVKAGPHRVSAAFIQNFEAIADDLVMPLENTLADVSIGQGITLLPHLRELRVIGPSRVTGISDTPSRRKIFSCRPTTSDEETACAREILKRLATQAFRSPVTADEVEALVAFYQEARSRNDFETGIRLGLQAILASPRFVFRFEEAPATIRPGQSYRISDADLASRLSYFLWGTMPDADLLTLAANRTLRAPGVVEKQVKRMLADRRSEALATRFAAQWLRLQDLDKVSPDYLQYPQYDDRLAAGFRRETELFFESLVRQDRSLLDLITADYSFVDERVAQHYGIPNVTGPHFRRVALPDNRRGILGHGSILVLTSNADRTSPVYRGKWVMEVLLGSPPPPPPPNVPELDEVKPTASGRTLSVRERMEEHRKNPTCNSCHRVIDPLGLALENYDPTGAWRIKDNEVAVDPVGVLYDGTRVEGPASLREALLRHKDAVVLSFTENLMTYALGRRVETYDMPAIRTIVKDAARNGYKMSAFINGVVRSAAFQMGRAPAADVRAADSVAR